MPSVREGQPIGRYVDLAEITDAAQRSLVPIGAIIPWAKSITSVPALPSTYLECNGQAVDDAESPIDGETLPDLNGNSNFLRGAATSGGTGGSSTHTHTALANTSSKARKGQLAEECQALGHTHSTNSGNNLPPYYEVVWIIRIK